MTLDEELEKIQELGLTKSAEIIKAFSEKPEVRLYVALGKIVDRIVEEVDIIIEGRQEEGKTVKDEILTGDDKLFERVNTLVIKFSEYNTAFTKGREGFNIEEEQKGVRKPLFGNKTE